MSKTYTKNTRVVTHENYEVHHVGKLQYHVIDNRDGAIITNTCTSLAQGMRAAQVAINTESIDRDWPIDPNPNEDDGSLDPNVYGKDGSVRIGH